MKLPRKWVVVSLAGTIAASAHAQEAATSPGGRVAEVTWTQDGTYEWTRPAHVRYVLVRACGGGGGGGGGYSLAPRPNAQDGTAVGGGGGAGAPVSTTLLGPLSAASYTVVIGRGGTGGASKVAAKSTTGTGPRWSTWYCSSSFAWRVPNSSGSKPRQRVSSIKNAAPMKTQITKFRRKLAEVRTKFSRNFSN